MPHFLLENVVRRYRAVRSRRPIEALRVRRLEIAPGEAVAVVGPNGSGKSTLLETLAFLAAPDEGRILLDGVDVWARRDALVARRRCPLLLQRAVLLKTSVAENIAYGLRCRGLPADEVRRRTGDALRRAGLTALADRKPAELSGGERQRVALARLLVLEPDVLLLDEPTAHVDPVNQELIEQAVGAMRDQRGTTVVVASHDFRQARRIADRQIAMVQGVPLEFAAENLFEGRLVRGATTRFESSIGWAMPLPSLDSPTESAVMVEALADEALADEALADEALADGALADEAVSDDSRAVGVRKSPAASSGGMPCYLAVDPRGVRLAWKTSDSPAQPGVAGGETVLSGCIVAVQRLRDGVEVEIATAVGCRLRATLAKHQAAESMPMVGATVACRIAATAIRVVAKSAANAANSDDNGPF